jgi:hypothetical protein
MVISANIHHSVHMINIGKCAGGGNVEVLIHRSSFPIQCELA